MRNADDGTFDSFKWVEEKSKQTEAKAGIDFETASRIFECDEGYVQREDMRREYGERRYIATGPVDDRIITVV